MFCIYELPASADLYNNYGHMPHVASVHQIVSVYAVLFCGGDVRRAATKKNHKKHFERAGPADNTRRSFIAAKGLPSGII